MFSYRPHIDGLRTVAVWLVVFFHINSGVFTGGYLGVDIFFVISGFVITQSLYKDYCTNGRINIFQFYFRRFKRLYPALVTMLVGTTVLYFVVGFLWDTNLYLKSAFSALFASSNLYFLYHGTNYFHQDLINPLVHTWSLGIEEQFYLLYPMFLTVGLFVVRRYKLPITTLVSFILLISISLYGMFAFNTGNVLGAFYFPFARFWELGFGCALSLFTISTTSTRYNQGWAFLGVGILVVLQFFERSINSIPVETLLAVIASSAIIFAGLRSHGVIERFLSTPVMVYMGKLSYSLYLWHLPVIYFANLYLTPELIIVVAPAVSVLCAMISYHFVENPLRYSYVLNSVIPRILKLAPVAIIVLIICVGLVGVRQTRAAINVGFNDFGKFIGSVNYIEKNFGLGERIQPNYLPGEDVMNVCLEKFSLQSITFDAPDSKCLKFTDTPHKPLFYLAGDSHALHFVPMLLDTNSVHNLIFDQRISSIKAIKSGMNLAEQESVVALDDQVQELRLLKTHFSEVYYVISLFITPYKGQVDVLEKVLRHHIEQVEPFAKVILVAPTPVFPGGPSSCVLLGKHCTISRANDLKDQQVIIDLLKRLDAEYNNVFVFDPYPLMCPEALCYNYISKTDTLLYIDDDHIAPQVSRLMAPAFDHWLRSNFTEL